MKRNRIKISRDSQNAELEMNLGQRTMGGRTGYKVLGKTLRTGRRARHRKSTQIKNVGWKTTDLRVVARPAYFHSIEGCAQVKCVGLDEKFKRGPKFLKFGTMTSEEGDSSWDMSHKLNRSQGIQAIGVREVSRDIRGIFLARTVVPA
jgi:hypothetical protein